MKLWLVVALAGCTGKGGGEDTQTSSSTSGTSAVAPGCEGVSVTDVGMNTAVVSWTPTDGASTRVDYDWGGDTLSTPTRDDGAHNLLGLAAEETISYSAVTIDGGTETTCEGTFETERLPTFFSGFNITVHEPSLLSDHRYVMGTFVLAPSAIYVINREGDVVWFHEADDERLISQASRVTDTTDIIYNSFDADYEDTTAILHRMTGEGETVSETLAADHHHSFTQLPDGSIGYIRIDVREWFDEGQGEMVDVAGDAIVEVAPDGTERVLFSTWDAFEPIKHDLWSAIFYMDAKDWTHGNGLRYVESSDTYLLSLGYANIVVEVDRETGVMTRYFGDGSDYDFAPGSLQFEFQHSAHFTDEGTLMMTSTAGSGIHTIEYEVDEVNKTLTEVWSHAKDEGHLVFAMGHTQRLENGNTLMSFGSGARIREVTADSEVAWEVRLQEKGMVLFGDLTAFDDFYSVD